MAFSYRPPGSPLFNAVRPLGASYNVFGGRNTGNIVGNDDARVANRSTTDLNYYRFNGTAATSPYYNAGAIVSNPAATVANRVYFPSNVANIPTAILNGDVREYQYNSLMPAPPNAQRPYVAPYNYTNAFPYPYQYPYNQFPYTVGPNSYVNPYNYPPVSGNCLNNNLNYYAPDAYYLPPNNCAALPTANECRGCVYSRGGSPQYATQICGTGLI